MKKQRKFLLEWPHISKLGIHQFKCESKLPQITQKRYLVVAKDRILSDVSVIQRTSKRLRLFLVRIDGDAVGIRRPAVRIYVRGGHYVLVGAVRSQFRPGAVAVVVRRPDRQPYLH